MNGITCQLECECTRRRRTTRSTRYYVEAEWVYRDDIGKFKTYGIGFYCAGRNKLLHDVSTAPETVLNIVDVLNRNGVSPVHLVEIVRELIP